MRLGKVYENLFTSAYLYDIIIIERSDESWPFSQRKDLLYKEETDIATYPLPSQKSIKSATST